MVKHFDVPRVLLFAFWIFSTSAPAIHPAVDAPDSDPVFQSTVKVETNTGAYGSGVFVNSTTVLTVGHVTDPNFAGGNVHVGGIPAVGVFSFHAFHRDPTPQGHPSPYDIAILVFPPGTAEKLGIEKFHPVTTLPTVFDEKVTLIGFSGGKRKMAYNTLLYENEEFLHLLGHAPGHGTGIENSIMEGGDSGGPLLNAKGAILGVASWNWWVPKDAVPARLAIYTKINKASVRRLFEDAIHCENPKYPSEVRASSKTGPCAENFPGSGVKD